MFKNRNVLLKFNRCYSSVPELPPCNFIPKKYVGPDIEKLKQIRNTRLNPALSIYYSSPVVFYQGYKQWLFDIDGKRYLDMFGGICTVSVGHCHPRITKAVTSQMETLNHVSNVYYHPKLHEYAEKLTEKFPEDLKVVYFVNSGSEANDLAILLARAYTRRSEIISLQNCYHGMSYQTMGLTSNSHYKYAVPQPPGFHQAMNPDVYRGIWGGSNCRDSPVQTTRNCSCDPSQCAAKEKYIEQFEDLFKYGLSKNNVAAFFAESIQGVGGTVQFPKNYLKDVIKFTRENGILFVSDEVQTGFGRTGDHFWGFEMHGIKPDIVTMAKGIGNGYPLAAVVTTMEVAKALTTASHFNTFGGNPVGSTVGITVLEVIEEEKLQENSKEVGTYLLLELNKLKQKYKIIGDVRGKGLMIGVELVAKENSTNPLPVEKFMKFWNDCCKIGLLVGRGGYHGNVIRIKPPMCITKADADYTVEVFKHALERIENC